MLVLVFFLQLPWFFVTLWTATSQAPQLSPGVCSNSCPLNHWSYLTILFSAHPLLLLPSIFPSIKEVFSNELAHRIRWTNYWELSFSISPSNEYLGLITFSIDWFDLLAVQETLQSLLLHHNLKAWIFWHSAFFIVQRSHLYLTEKTITLTIQTLLEKGRLSFLICCLSLS